MVERKPLGWFLGIAFAFSWPLFLAPLLFRNAAPTQAQLITAGFWALGMWGPGLAAILTTRFVMKQPLRTLHLNRLGPKRFYVWAWFLPPSLALLGGLFTLLFGLARFDRDFTLIHEAMTATPGGGNMPAGVIAALQLAFAVLLAPFINVLFALGEELGWRSFLLPRLLPLGQWKAMLLGGAVWGLWHAPAIVQGLNYPGHPILGIGMMIVLCVLLGIIFSWLYLNAQSPWVAALAHGSVNAAAGLPVLFLQPGFNIAFGGTLATPPAWIGMGLFIAWLIVTKRLPVKETEQAEKTTGTQ